MTTTTTAPLDQAELQAVPGKMRAILTELTDELYERGPQLEALMLGDISGHNTFMLGPPGTAKSLLIRSQCARYVGANYWEILLDRQLPMESIFGPIDIKEFEATGNWHRRTDGYAPWAHKIFLDEVGKAGPAVLNPLLTLLNEGLFHNNSVPMQANILSAAGASNEELVAIDPELAALWDRWLIRILVEPIKEPGNFAALLQSAVTTPVRQAPTTISLTEIEAARIEARKINLPPGIVDRLLELKANLRAEQIEPSDRRWKQSVELLQASAYLNGRSAIDEDDLGVLRHVAWDVVEQISTVEKKVLAVAGETSAKLVQLRTQLEDIENEIEARRGQAMEEKAKYGGEANFKLGKIGKELTETIEQLDRQGRSTARFHELRAKLTATKQRVLTECLNLPADRGV